MQAIPAVARPRWVQLSLATAGLSFALLALAYPGRATNDTLGWMIQVRRHDFVDIQPPGAPLILSLFDPIWPGPFSLVAFNIVLLCLGLMLFWAGFLRSAGAALAASLAALAYPAVLTILPVAWRDITGLAITILTLAVALRLWNAEKEALSTQHRTFLWGSMIVLGFVGALFRSNHAAGALPLVVLALYPALQRYLNRSRVLSIATATAAASIILVAATLIALSLSSAIARPVYSMQAWKLYRLAQMSVELRKNLLPASLYPRIGVPELETLLNTSKAPYRYVFWTAYSRANSDMLPVIKEPEQYRILSAHFSDAVLEHPGTFMAISLREMWTYINWWRVPGGSYYVADQPSGIFRVTSTRGAELTLEINWPTAVPSASARLLSGWSGLARPVLVRNPLPIMTLAIVLAVLATISRLPAAQLIVAAALSAVAHFVGIIWIAALFDFRFGHQSIALSVIAILLFAIDAARAVRSRGNPSAAG